jgi:enoyl-CoA hydratase/carnithine racemase
MQQLATMFWEKDGQVARLTLNRPERLNAMNNQATMDLNAVAEAIAADDAIRLVVITGTGRSFSTGIDLKQLSANEIEMVYHQRFERALRTFETMEKLVMVGIKQYCLGGGLQLALASDIRVAADDAILGLPAIKECLIPGLSTYRLARYVGLGRTKRLILSGLNISAAEAFQMGLVDHVVPLEDFDAKLEELVQQYLSNNSTATRLSKLLINETFNLDYDAALGRYMQLQEIAQTSADHFEAKRAYAEKRAPVWG